MDSTNDMKQYDAAVTLFQTIASSSCRIELTEQHATAVNGIITNTRSRNCCIEIRQNMAQNGLFDEHLFVWAVIEGAKNLLHNAANKGHIPKTVSI